MDSSGPRDPIGLPATATDQATTLDVAVSLDKGSVLQCATPPSGAIVTGLDPGEWGEMAS